MFDLMTNQNFSFNFKRNIFLAKILANAPLSINICKYMYFIHTYIHGIIHCAGIFVFKSAILNYLITEISINLTIYLNY